LLETSSDHTTTFAERLLESEEFQATAAISALGGSHEWFKNVIVFERTRAAALERLCQYINQLLLNEYIVGMLERTIALSFYGRLMQILQERRLEDFFIADAAASCWNNSIGLSFLVQFLGRLMLVNVRRAFLARSGVAKARASSVIINEHSLVVDVNKVVGFSIFSLRNKLIADSKRLSSQHVTEASVTRQSLVETEIDLLHDMRIFEAEALLDDNYLRIYYDPELQVKNHGYMTLVSSQYFPWGVVVMRFFAEHANSVQRECYGKMFAKTVQDAIDADSLMSSKFLECAKDFVALSDEQKQSVHARLVTKIKNTKISDVVKSDGERLTGRRSNNVQDQPLRQKLRAQSGGKKRKKSS
jgi:hypothetical protein